jgi:predicted acetyltransferase
MIDHDEFIGRLSLRCQLNAFMYKVAGHIGYQVRPGRRCQGYGTELLHLGLIKAFEHGLTQALVTCDETNIASRKVIEHNGGVFENAVTVEGSPILKLRYWIDLSSISAPSRP